MRESAFAVAKRFTRSDSRSDEVARIWSRWTRAQVPACRYCGQPMYLHQQGDCERVRREISEEEHNG